MEERGLVIDDKYKAMAPVLFMIWYQFNQANEVVNCVGAVDTRKIDISKWPRLEDKSSNPTSKT